MHTMAFKMLQCHFGERVSNGKRYPYAPREPSYNKNRMEVAKSAQEAELQLANNATDDLVRNLGIPPRPQTLTDLQTEIASEDPDFRKIARLVSSDVALTAALLRIVNSPALALSRKCETLDQAVSMVGLRQINVMVTGLVLRKVLRCDGPQLTRFWDVSAKRAYSLGCMARELGGVEPDLAQTFGLFCDVGIPLLMRRFTDYGETLKICNEEPVRSFTEVEQERHHTDHALIGGLMARSWGISPVLCTAIRLHHDYAVFHDPKVADAVLRLIAMGLFAEISIQRFAGMNVSNEWNKGGELAMGALMLSDQEAEDWIERLLADYATGKA